MDFLHNIYKSGTYNSNNGNLKTKVFENLPFKLLFNNFKYKNITGFINLKAEH